MPIFLIAEEQVSFPDPSLANENGLLAVGGDLSVRRLLCAYSQGIFPWYMTGSPILWWFSNPRCVLFPARLHIPRSLKKVLASGYFSFTVNAAFADVIRSCASFRSPGREDTWIVPEMINAYIEMHKAGWAHSVEAWAEGKLAGGLYGVALGRVFFGESMFYSKADASKAAFAWLTLSLHGLGFQLVDCQQDTRHMRRFGAEMLSGEQFSGLLHECLSSSLALEGKARNFFRGAQG